MKTSTLKKSILDYAIKGRLSSKFRESNPNLSATCEIEAYNQNIQERRKAINKELKTLDSKQDKEKIKKLKNELAKLKEIKILEDSAPFEIPNTWAWVKLGEVCEIQSGGTPDRSTKDFWENGNISWVKISDISDNMFLNSTQEYITQKGLENSSAKIFQQGTILYTIFATLGEVCILNINAATNQAIAGLNPNIKLDTKFLVYFLKSIKDSVNQMGRGPAQKNINMNILKTFLIPLPPLKEQEEIVKILDELFILKENLRVE